MSDIPLGLLLFLVILLFLSAFFSSAETAYSSANKIRIKSYADENRSGGQKAYFISQHFDHALSTILIGNNLVNIAAATISAQIATTLFGANTGLVVSTVVMTILVLIFGEVLPKSFAKENAEPFALKIAGILTFLMKLFKPLTWILVQLKERISALVTKQELTPSITEQELKEMVTISEEEGVIENHEKELLHNSLDFNDIRVVEILTPRTDVFAIDVEMPVDEVTALLFEERYSRIPVYEGNIDNIIGILSERDFLSHLIKHKDVNIREIVRKPMFVIETLTVSTLLPILQKNRVHMAVVIDEFGGTSGIITLEDILEELVGEIWDEHDDKVRGVDQLEENLYEFYGDFDLDDFARLAKIELPDSTNHTLGGWLVELFQKVPTDGEQLEYEHLTITVVEAEERRIIKVKVEINQTV
ncbi:hemolysin family protein [Alkalihalobacterium elongatum]|uniref:hemolysin family protein n=1 Tax=Alkalihalobacterium elongatum TaxID=2675466 RepID=UPI001C200D0C|nr:hemolysin family protein [Alkalihalobacterium elongatum]